MDMKVQKITMYLHLYEIISGGGEWFPIIIYHEWFKMNFLIMNHLTESLMHLFHFAVYYSSMPLESKGEF